MILDHPLTPEQKAQSRRNFYCFNSINGVSYMCLGDTIVILLAVKLGTADWLVSALGAMVYVGYLLLPLGKWMTGRVGAARSQAEFWVLRNAAALLVALAVVWNHFGWHGVALASMFIGTLFFNGFRAAGVVMSQPLIGEVTDEETQGPFLGMLNGIFHLACLVALVAISLVMYHESEWTLMGVIIFGSLCGITAQGFLRKVYETRQISLTARKPLGPELRWALGNKALLRQLASGFVINLAVILTVPVSMLVVKRGYGVTDTEALQFSLAQFGGASLVSFYSGKLARRLGPRLEMLMAYLGLIAMAVIWLVLPNELNRWLMLVFFFLLGGWNVCLLNSVMHYFLQSVTEEHRVSSSIFISLITGACAGLAGMFVSGGLLKGTAGMGENLLSSYRWYFASVALLLLPGVWCLLRLPKMASASTTKQE